MNDRWQEVERLFHDVVDLPPDERKTYLDEICREDSILRDEVESLVAAEGSETEFLDEPALGAGFSGLPGMISTKETQESLIGQQIGPYRLVREVACGGMGVVYMAERADKQYESNVAVKLIKRGMDSEQILFRFRQERQTLANLDHVHIARLLDGGMTEDGRPYLVMEYIDGKPIDEYCDAHNLSVAERITLFLSVCSAVHYAHQNLVVHRDLKPANIMVTERGVPKLLDFGIAKVLKDDRGGSARTKTEFGSRLLTPEYASPEQLLGSQMTTGSDVYSLGVILYELLTGCRPYDLRRRPEGAVERTVCCEEPARPSTVIGRTSSAFSGGHCAMQSKSPAEISETRSTTPEGLRRKLRGDLDNIVMMAMRKDPHRRYTSVEQLSEDLRRYQEGRPVLAQRDTLRYRATKFLKRNRVAVAAALLVSLSLMVCVVGIAWEARATRIQRDAAKANLVRAEQAETQAAEEARRAKSEAEVAKQALDFFKEVFRNPDSVAGPDTPVTAREILDRGVARLEVELRDRPAIRATLLDNIGWAYLSLGLPQRAQDLLEEALAIRIDLFGEDHLIVAESLNSLGELHRKNGSFDRSIRCQRQVLRIHRELLGTGDINLVRSLSNLALTYVDSGDCARAEPLLDEAIAISRAATERGLADEWEEAESILLNNAGGLRFESGRFAEAESLFREAVSLRRRHLGDRHPVLANAMHNLGKAILRQGRLDEARPLIVEALTVRRELLEQDHPSVAKSLHWLAALEYEQANFEQALENCAEALRIREAKLPAGSPLIADSESLVGACLNRLGRYEEAEKLLLRSYAVLVQRRDENSLRTYTAKQRIIELYEAWGRPDLAQQWREASDEDWLDREAYDLGI